MNQVDFKIKAYLHQIVAEKEIEKLVDDTNNPMHLHLMEDTHRLHRLRARDDRAARDGYTTNTSYWHFHNNSAILHQKMADKIARMVEEHKNGRKR